METREEIFEVLAGRFRFRYAGEEFETAPGISVVISRNSVHDWLNLSPEMSRLLFIFKPGGIDGFFPQIGQTLPESWTDLARQYDTWIVRASLSAE